MTEITLKELYKLRLKLKDRMVILNKLKTDGYEGGIIKILFIVVE